MGLGYANYREGIGPEICQPEILWDKAVGIRPEFCQTELLWDKAVREQLGRENGGVMEEMKLLAFADQDRVMNLGEAIERCGIALQEVMDFYGCTLLWDGQGVKVVQNPQRHYVKNGKPTVPTVDDIRDNNDPAFKPEDGPET